MVYLHKVEKRMNFRTIKLYHLGAQRRAPVEQWTHFFHEVIQQSHIVFCQRSLFHKHQNVSNTEASRYERFICLRIANYSCSCPDHIRQLLKNSHQIVCGEQFHGRNPSWKSSISHHTLLRVTDAGYISKARVHFGLLRWRLTRKFEQNIDQNFHKPQRDRVHDIWVKHKATD